MDKLLIVGAGGHGRVTADIAVLSKRHKAMAFVDDVQIQSKTKCPIISTFNDIDQLLPGCDVVVAIGDNETRKAISVKLEDLEASVVSLIHPTAVIAQDVALGTGTIIMANAVISCGSNIGKGVIVNTAATIDHDCQIADYVHISPGAHLAGGVCVGEGTWVGIGATVIQGICICEGCVIGAGAVVTKSIFLQGTYVGVPARLVSE